MPVDAAVLIAPEPFLKALVFASLRPGAMLALMPATGRLLIPVQLRIGLAGALAILMLGSPFPPRPPADLFSLAGLAAIAGELLIGAVAALALHAAFAAAAAAGDWAAQAMGLGFASGADPSGAPAPVLGALFQLLMWALFLIGGGHLLLIRVLVESHAAMPTAGALFEPARLLEIIGWGGFALSSGVLAALPLGAGLLLLNLLLALASRSAPQLNLFSIGFPAMLLSGLAFLPLLLPGLADGFARMLAAMQDRLAALLLG